MLKQLFQIKIDQIELFTVFVMKGVIRLPAENDYYLKDPEYIVNKYGNMLFRICFVMLGNSFDAEDAVQETFVKHIKKNKEFESEEHIKAWLIRVATNKSRDILRFRFKHTEINIEDLSDMSVESEDGEIISVLYELPEKLKIVLYLYYVEEYKVDEIAKIIGKTPSAVKMRLKKGREELKKNYLELKKKQLKEVNNEKR